MVAWVWACVPLRALRGNGAIGGRGWRLRRPASPTRVCSAGLLGCVALTGCCRAAVEPVGCHASEHVRPYGVFSEGGRASGRDTGQGREQWRKRAAGGWACTRLHPTRARPVFRDAAGLLGERSSCRASPAPGRLQQSHRGALCSRSCCACAVLAKLRCAGNFGWGGNADALILLFTSSSFYHLHPRVPISLSPSLSLPLLLSLPHHTTLLHPPTPHRSRLHGCSPSTVC